MNDNPAHESEDIAGAALTEQLDPLYHGIDTWSGGRVLGAIHDAQLRAVNAVGSVAREIAAAAEDASKRLEQGQGRLIYIGAGTSARLGVQDGTELTPTYGWPEKGLPLLSPVVPKPCFVPWKGRKIMKKQGVRI